MKVTRRLCRDWSSICVVSDIDWDGTVAYIGNQKYLSRIELQWPICWKYDEMITGADTDRMSIIYEIQRKCVIILLHLICQLSRVAGSVVKQVSRLC